MNLTDELAKYLGLFVAIIVGMMVIYRIFNLQSDIIEGMTSSTDSKEISENVKNKASKIMDGLLIDKYRENYENTLTNLQELSNAIILKHMVSSNSENMGDKFFPMVEKINSLEKFKGAINNSMKFLDSK
jgi:hypothetical protein